MPQDRPLGSSWATLGPSWGQFGANLAPFWANLGSSCTSRAKISMSQWFFNGFKVSTGSCWGHCGSSWSCLGPSWGHFGPSRGFCGAILGHLGGFGSRHQLAIPFPPVSGLQQGAISGHLGAISGAKMAHAQHGLKMSPDGLKMDQYGCKMAPTTLFLRVFFWMCSFVFLFAENCYDLLNHCFFPGLFNVRGPC